MCAVWTNQTVSLGRPLQGPRLQPMFSQVNDGQVHRLHGCLFECVLKRLCPSCQLMVLVLGWTPGSKRKDWQHPEARALLLAYSVRSMISQSRISAVRISFPEKLFTALVSLTHLCLSLNCFRRSCHGCSGRCSSPLVSGCPEQRRSRKKCPSRAIGGTTFRCWGART